MPQADKIWICLLVAHHRCGNHERVKELLATMRQNGLDEDEINKIERNLNEPPPNRVDAVRQLIEKQDVVSAEIAARLLVRDFPDHATAEQLLQEVLAKIANSPRCWHNCQHGSPANYRNQERQP